jgi:hypothetical protein
MQLCGHRTMTYRKKVGVRYRTDNAPQKPDSVHVVFDAAIQSGDHYTLSGSAEQQTDPRRHDERPALRYYSELPTDSCRLSERSKSAPLPASKRIPGAYGIQIAAPGPAA